MIRLEIVFCIFFCIGVCSCIGNAGAQTVKALFADPPGEYTTVPFWVWNDYVSEQEIIETLNDLAGQSIRQVIVHPRPGLMTPYLSEQWFDLWDFALKQAKQLNMDLWIYDENSYPSGFAGGLVPEAMPQSRGKGLDVHEENKCPQWSEDIVAVYRAKGSGYENITAKVRAGEKPGDDKYMVASLIHAENAAWHGGYSYVNLLEPGVTEKFLEITLEPYRKRFGKEFGKRIPASFSDEPHICPAGGLAWNDDLPEMFEKRWGYSLLDHLPSMVHSVGDFKRVRHNYFQLILELFIDRWAKPYYDYCQKNNLEFTGHYWEHAWPACSSVPDNMAMSAWQHRPGIDILMNRYDEWNPTAQFGNIRSVKELASVANQLGCKRTLCEAYGAAGWNLRFEDMKRIGDWLSVLGVNTINEHLSYMTIRGARKYDHPQSFSYHEPWWPAYHELVEYFTRLSAALSQGQQINDVLILEPTTTVWMYQFDATAGEHLKKLSYQFQEIVTTMAKAQLEFDIGCEDIIVRHGSVAGAGFKIGQRTYNTVILPPGTENLNGKTIELLEAYVKNGGNVLCCSEAPEFVDGVKSNRAGAAATKPSWKRIDAGEIVGILLKQSKGGFAIERSNGDKGILLHHRRQIDSDELLFLANTSIDSPTTGTIKTSAKGIEQWHLETGEITGYPFVSQADGVAAEFELPACGSALFFLSDKPVKSEPKVSQKSSAIQPAGPCLIHRSKPNVLTMDYLDLTIAGETLKGTHAFVASTLAFQKNGFDANPWSSAVQFRDKLIAKKIDPQIGFDVTYRFTIDGAVPANLFVVIERSDLYSVTCNGVAVSAEAGSWWLDRAFGKIDIASAAKTGENEVVIKTDGFTVYHEIEPAYLLGDFMLKPVEHGFVLVADEQLKFGPWNSQGHPFYADGISYSQDFDIEQLKGTYKIGLRKWYGSVAEVFVNGKSGGYIYHQPWECDVTQLIKAGKNTVEVVVTGSLKNTLGPHHGKPDLCSAWPGMFHNAPKDNQPAGDQYDTIGYGLFEPFELLDSLDDKGI